MSRPSPGPSGKHLVTDAHAWFLAGPPSDVVARVAEAFPLLGHRIPEPCMAVDWGLAHRDLSSVAATAWTNARRRGHRYLTLVYQIDRPPSVVCARRERKAATLQAFFDWFGAATQ